MMSLDSAYGPSVMVRCLPFTSLPLRSSGCPWSLMWPCAASCFIHAIHVCMLFCICSGDPMAARLASLVLRYRYTNALMVTPFGARPLSLGLTARLPTVKTFEGRRDGHVLKRSACQQDTGPVALAGP